MFKWLALLLIVLTAAGSFFPCCAEDDCLDDIAMPTDCHRQEHEDNGNCSPFFACGTCSAAVDMNRFPELALPEIGWHNTAYAFYQINLSTYHSTLFQPPRFV